MPEVLTAEHQPGNLKTAATRATGSPLIGADRISRRVHRLGREISSTYAGMVEGTLVRRHVLLVEDIVDSGRTADVVTKRVSKLKPASLRLAALLDRPARRSVEVHIDFRGFTIPDRFVIGYGLDYAGLYREL